jgi:predicted phosphoribosyltransferase
MARIIADALDGDMDVVLVRELRAPGRLPPAVGAVDENGTVLKDRYFGLAAEEYLLEEVRTQLEILRTRRDRYTPAQAAVEAAGRIAIIVDDGVAGEWSMRSAIRAVRARNPEKVVVAVGVAPPSSLARMQREADEVVCLSAPDDFFAVGQFFDDYAEVTDDMVVAALSRPQAAMVRQPV